MSSVQKKRKLTVKSDTWYVDFNVIQQVGFQESPLFGTESTKFYWCAERCGAYYSFHLYLATCPEEQINVEAKYWFGNSFPPKDNYTIKGDVSLDKTHKIGSDSWDNASRFTLTEVTFEEIVVSATEVTQQKHYEALCSHVANFRENSNSADITLVTTVDGQEFPAHKLILTLRSTVFAAMFQNPECEENQTNRLKIDDATGEVMDALLQYIYSGNIQGIEKIAGDLLPAADKYDIPLLVERTMPIWIILLNKSDRSETCLEDAKKKVSNFMAANFQEVRNSDAWKQFIGYEQLQQFVDLLLLPKA